MDDNAIDNKIASPGVKSVSRLEMRFAGEIRVAGAQWYLMEAQLHLD